MDIIENELKLDLIDTPDSNCRFVFPLSHEEKLIVKKEVALLKRKYIVAKANVTEKIHLYLEFLPDLPNSYQSIA